MSQLFRIFLLSTVIPWEDQNQECVNLTLSAFQADARMQTNMRFNVSGAWIELNISVYESSCNNMQIPHMVAV